MPKRAKDFMMRTPGNKPNQDWFRIVNKKKDDSAAEDVTEIYIYNEIGFWGTSAQDFVKELMMIDTSKIYLHINSPGGEIFDGVAIYNALKMHSAEVTVTVDALAASAASFIAMAGDHIVMTRNATMMIHDGIAFCYGNADDMQDTADILNKLSNNIADIYMQRAGGTLEEWRGVMKEEAWYNAEEAVAAKLADEIQGASEENADNKFELLKFFNHLGRNDAPSPTDVKRRVFNMVKEAKIMGTKPVTPLNEGTPPGTEPEGTEEEVEPTGEEVVPPEGSEVQEPETPPNTSNKFSFKMGGRNVTDPVAIQKHIDTLEGFQQETVTENRKAFIKSLADSSRITAPQVDKLEKFALGLSNEQYESWLASWDAAPSLGLLGSHAAGSRDGGEVLNAQATADDKLDVARNIVRQHKLSGMPVDKIEQTDSYKAVMKMDPTFELSKL